MSTSTSIYRKSCATGALRQGEIVSNLVHANVVLGRNDDGVPGIREVTHRFAITVSQDCDLEWDWKARYCNGNTSKLISSVLFCEVELADELKSQSESWYTSKMEKKLLKHEVERYQLLQEIDAKNDYLGKGVPRLVVDFKRFFSLPPDELYARLEMNDLDRRSLMNYPYLQHLITRFLNFQGRVALP